MCKRRRPFPETSRLKGHQLAHAVGWIPSSKGLFSSHPQLIQMEQPTQSTPHLENSISHRNDKGNPSPPLAKSTNAISIKAMHKNLLIKLGGKKKKKKFPPCCWLPCFTAVAVGLPSLQFHPLKSFPGALKHQSSSAELYKAHRWPRSVNMIRRANALSEEHRSSRSPQQIWTWLIPMFDCYSQLLGQKVFHYGGGVLTGNCWESWQERGWKGKTSIQ